jgi:hypothetical protein
MRLTDADKLNFSEQHYNKSQMKAILDFVDAQPTAFDVDELLKQLEENFKPDIECFDYAEDYEYSLERYNRIIETVKRGGKEQ